MLAGAESLPEKVKKSSVRVCSILITSWECTREGNWVARGGGFETPRSSDLSIRLVSATGFRGEQVAGRGIGAGTRAAANSAEETASALALQPGTIVQGHEQRRVAIHLSQRLGHHVARGQRQKTAGIYLATVVDEDEA